MERVAKTHLLIAHFARSFAAALVVLVVLKLILVVMSGVGDNAVASPGKLASKVPLLLGRDVIGAGLVAVVGAALGWSADLLGLARAGRAVCVAVQCVAALLAAVSFFTTLYVGGPLNKETIELSQFGTGADGGGATWSSVMHYLGPLQVAVMVGAMALASLTYFLAPRFFERIGKRGTRAAGSVALVLAVITCLLLPWLINGHVAGIRVHTYGLESSAGVEFVWSYAKPALRGLSASDRARIADEFRFGLGARDPLPRASNPLRSARPRETNLILVALESVGAKYLRKEPRPMPYLTGLRDQAGAVYLENHYTVWPQTMKAFFSIFCSELPYPDYRPITNVNPAIPCESLSEVLHRRGYYNAFITSADLVYDRKRLFFNHRRFDQFTDMRNMPGREKVWGNAWGLDERIAVENILKLARERRESRFFVFYEMMTAHHPYNACQEHVDNPLPSEFEAYERALGYIDDRIRDLVAGIDRLGLADETLIAVVSDHGEGFGQHPGSKSHGTKVYQENVHVPFAIIGPQLREIAGVVDMATSHIDVAPTLLGLLGIDVPCTMKGRDLAAGSIQHAALFGGRPPGGQKGLVDGRWKYIREDSGADLLYDLFSDPDERSDLSAHHSGRVEAFRERIERWEFFSENLIERYAEILRQSDCRPGS
jgi:hypothetical protein